MGSPFEYREMMRAHMHYNETRSVDQVLAEQRQRHDAAMKGKRTVSSGATLNSLPQTEVDKVKAMLANAQPRPEPATE